MVEWESAASSHRPGPKLQRLIFFFYNNCLRTKYGIVAGERHLKASKKSCFVLCLFCLFVCLFSLNLSSDFFFSRGRRRCRCRPKARRCEVPGRRRRPGPAAAPAASAEAAAAAAAATADAIGCCSAGAARAPWNCWPVCGSVTATVPNVPASTRRPTTTPTVSHAPHPRFFLGGKPRSLFLSAQLGQFFFFSFKC